VGNPQDPDTELRSRLRRWSNRVVFGYLAVAGLWIMVSDRVLATLAPDLSTVVWVGLLKGLAFVGATGLLLHVLLRRTTRAIARGFEVVENERRFAEDVVEALPGIFYLYDSTGRFLRWNHNFRDVSGCSDDEIGRMDPLDFFAGPEKELVASRIDEVFEGGEASVEASFMAKDGRAIPHFFTGRRIEFADATCLVGVGVDITERVEAEAELQRAERAVRELNRNLERKVEGRTRELEDARERAEAADRIKSAFLATMSHELRTPLNSIIGFTGMVQQGLAGPLTEEQSKQLGMAQVSARHLLSLINDVLDISKIEAGQLEVRREAFDLTQSVEQVAATVAPRAEEKALALRLDIPDGPLRMVSDQRRVEQILLNLLTNAIKFTDRGTVSLAVERTFEPTGLGGDRDDTATAVRIRVSDTGVGIREEDIPFLFRPFGQLDTGLQRQHEGTGLGLAICRQLSTLLGGEIRAESVRGEGSTFTVVLPMDSGAPSNVGVEA
jgi:PAS domain S-box-containing protein